MTGPGVTAFTHMSLGANYFDRGRVKDTLVAEWSTEIKWQGLDAGPNQNKGLTEVRLTPHKPRWSLPEPRFMRGNSKFGNRNASG